MAKNARLMAAAPAENRARLKKAKSSSGYLVRVSRMAKPMPNTTAANTDAKIWGDVHPLFGPSMMA